MRVLRQLGATTVARGPAELLDGICAAGLDGFEASLDDLGARADAMRTVAWLRAAQERGLSVVLTAYSSWRGYGEENDSAKPVDAHAQALLVDLRAIADAHARTHASPLVGISCHTGTDAWTEAQGATLFKSLSTPVRELQLPRLSHDTHRARFLGCPRVAASLLSAVPSVRLASSWARPPSGDFLHARSSTIRPRQGYSPGDDELMRAALASACDHVVLDCADASSQDFSNGWWEHIWDAREAASFSERDSLVTSTIGCAGSALSDEDVATGVRQVRERFERWHNDASFRRMNGT
jgi:hypothetical protein